MGGFSNRGTPYLLFIFKNDSPQQQETPSSDGRQLYDAAFSLSALSIVNSPAYGGMLRFATVQEADYRSNLTAGQA